MFLLWQVVVYFEVVASVGVINGDDACKGGIGRAVVSRGNDIVPRHSARDAANTVG